MKEYFVYLLSNHKGLIYTGVTNNLFRRVYEHKFSQVYTFTSKYKCNKLIYYETHTSIISAISREKQIKKRSKKKKINIAKTINPSLVEIILTF